MQNEYREYPKLPDPDQYVFKDGSVISGTEMLSFASNYMKTWYYNLFLEQEEKYDRIYWDLGNGECLEVNVKLTKWDELKKPSRRNKIQREGFRLCFLVKAVTAVVEKMY